MCDPVSLAGAALSGVGMAANSIAANEVSHATNAAIQQEQQLNGIQQQRAFNSIGRAAGEYKGFQQGQEAMGAKLGDVLQSRSVDRAPPPSNMAPTGAATTAALAAGTPAVEGYGDQQAHALGNLRSFGDYLADRNRAAARPLEVANQATNFMRGNAGALGLQLDDASHAGDTASLFGGIASGLGGLGIKAGLNGYGGIPGYGSPLGSLFGGDPTYYQVRQAGLDAGLTAFPDGSVG